ncbi:hypothetical protein CYMTET_57070 [Cymbomonas tetramitiformis]|uniref:DUF4042 domain-containing protein n=1 Tax=Cymbomonas tetramitiformis TaxID=36881 RepID=A0AAE0ELB1_9CHLO|nr:hypothetical protein CYMTET_57070 [Cymbomonas tetramitiformis]
MCHLVTNLYSRVTASRRPSTGQSHASTHASAALPLTRLLCEILQATTQRNLVSPTPAAMGRRGSGPEADHLSLEAMRALRALLKDGAEAEEACQSPPLFEMLLAVAMGTAPIRPAGGGLDLWVDKERMAWELLGALATKAMPGTLSRDQRCSLVQGISRMLQAVCADRSQAAIPVESARSKYMAEILHTLHQALADGGEMDVTVPVTGLVGSLHALMLYGLDPNDMDKAPSARTTPPSSPQPRGQSAVSSPDAKKPGAYQPPFMRQKSLSSPSPGKPGLSSPVETGRGRRESAGRGSTPGSSESDASDNESAGDTAKTFKARANALRCLQAIARLDPKGLQAHWLTLLPSQNVLQRRPYSPSLLTPLLYDPSAKVRLAAAGVVSSMLEGGVNRQYLAVAEARQKSKRRDVRAFITLSTQLGDIALQLHLGLAHAVVHEASLPVLSAALKAMSALLGGAPYARLPQHLLAQALSRVQARLLQLLLKAALPGTAGTETAAACLAALRAIATGLGAKGRVAGLGMSMTEPAESGPAPRLTVQGATSPSSGGGSPGADTGADAADMAEVQKLPEILLEVVGSTKSNALHRVEAFTALRALGRNYLEALCSVWDRLAPVMMDCLCISSSGGAGDDTAGRLPPPTGTSSSSTPADERIAQQVSKLLAEVLQTAGGIASDGDEDSSSSPFPHLSAGQEKTTGEASVEKDPGGSAEWRMAVWSESTHSVLLAALQHTAPAVRSAAQTAIGALCGGCFVKLPVELHASLHAAAADAAMKDPAPPVRAAACRALGIMVGLEHMKQHRGFLVKTTEVLLACMGHGSQAVRIAGTWAGANLCNVLRETLPTTSTTSEEGNDCVALEVMQQMVAAAVEGTRDTDKVRANGVRALGYLARSRLLHGGNRMEGGALAAELGTLESAGGEVKTGATGDMLELIVQALLTCLPSSTVKVQWNVCCALGGLLHTHQHAEGGAGKAVALETTPWGSATLSSLLDLLQTSQNFKIRTHAAAAVAVPKTRAAWGSLYTSAIPAVLAAFEVASTSLSLSDQSKARPLRCPATRRRAPSEPCNTAGSWICDLRDRRQVGAAQGWPSAAIPEGCGMEAAGAEGVSAARQPPASSKLRVDFADLKYRPVLGMQLSGTAVHLLSLGDVSDVVDLSDVLLFKGRVLVEILRERAEDAGMLQPGSMEAECAESVARGNASWHSTPSVETGGTRADGITGEGVAHGAASHRSTASAPAPGESKAGNESWDDAIQGKVCRAARVLLEMYHACGAGAPSVDASDLHCLESIAAAAVTRLSNGIERMAHVG